MPKGTWRESARATIQDVIQETGTEDLPALKRALFEAYPFGERKHYPYKVWLQEVNHTLTMISRKQRVTIPYAELRDYWTK